MSEQLSWEQIGDRARDLYTRHRQEAQWVEFCDERTRQTAVDYSDKAFVSEDQSLTKAIRNAHSETYRKVTEEGAELYRQYGPQLIDMAIGEMALAAAGKADTSIAPQQEEMAGHQVPADC